jgi:hypothetical protein
MHRGLEPRPPRDFDNRTSCHTCKPAWQEPTCELPRLFETAERSSEIGAEDLGEIAALLDENGRKT